MNSKTRGISVNQLPRTISVGALLFSIVAFGGCSSNGNSSDWVTIGVNTNGNSSASTSPAASPSPASTPTGEGTGLPVEIRAQLDERYAGWKPFRGDRNCTSQAVVSGRFNGDGVIDYAVMFKQGGRGYVLVFLSNNGGYTYQVLENMSSKQTDNFFLYSAKKGEEYGEIIDDDFNRATRVLQYDAPGGGGCESSSYLWIYKNGKFKTAFTSD